eukprot:12965012-Alexandrium_andersonii.AAC.1
MAPLETQHASREKAPAAHARSQHPGAQPHAPVAHAPRTRATRTATRARCVVCAGHVLQTRQMRQLGHSSW